MAACGDDGERTAGPKAPVSSGSETPIQEPSETADASADLRAAAQAYSNAYLTGDDKAAYSLLSKRCQERTTAADFAEIVAGAADLYGKAIPFTTFKADVSGDMARVTYTYKDVPAIDQEAEPWVREGGKWHEDDC